MKAGNSHHTPIGNRGLSILLYHQHDRDYEDARGGLNRSQKEMIGSTRPADYVAAMGMFDYVRSEIPLPDGFTGELQSKAFDCIMTIILIRADGRLMVEEREFERLPPCPDDPPPFNRLERRRPIHRGWKDLNYHGDFRFNGYEAAPSGEDYVPHDYVARFTHGTLEYIKNENERPDGHPRTTKLGS